MKQFVSYGHLKNYIDNSDKKHCVIFDDIDDAFVMSDIIKASDIFAPWELLPFEPFYSDIEKAAERFKTLYKVKNNNINSLFSTVVGIFQKIGPMEVYEKYYLKLKKNVIIEHEEFIKKLTRMGYERSYEVRYPGQYAVRGEIVDIYISDEEFPYRVVFYDREIETIKKFNPETQLTIENVHNLVIVPLKEIIFGEHLDFDRMMNSDIPVLEFMENETYDGINKDYPLIYDNYNSILDLLDEEWEVLRIGNKPIKDVFQDMLEVINNVENDEEKIRKFFFDKIDQKRVKNTKFVKENDSFRRLEKNISDKKLIQQMDLWKQKNYEIIYYFDNKAQKQNFKENFLTDTKNCKFIIDSFSGSYLDKVNKRVYISESEILGKSYEQKNIEYAKGYNEHGSIIKDINKGDLIVHIDYGIGVYRGVENEVIAGKRGDYVLIEYKDDSKIYVPVNHLDKVEKYIGDKEHVRINSLSDNLWKKTKAKVKNKVRDFAINLLKLQAERQMREGYKFSKDTKWQKNFEESFPHEPTRDQLRAIKEIKEDMESEKVMERLLCGDVGFGKTEVAMRAAFKAVQDGKQVVVLAPTTVLAIQHYKTFKDRMIEYPVDIAMLSRLVKKSETKKIKKKIKEGLIDIVIGTHKVLSSKIKYNDIGLLIIDEEQRFGVMQKEKLKLEYKNIDMLTLTATPIPRTLYMSLVGIMDLSRLETPPKNRHPVKTKAISFDEELLSEIIYREYSRNGQVYFIHNRVKDIKEIRKNIEEIVSDEINVSHIHGQMSSKKIESKILKFMDSEIDVLVSTTIIENGIDISNVNTIIINKAHHFGLSQLYQLRGRVGRRELQAYSYLIVPNNISQIAKERINALLNYEHLGAGYEISMRDLEIRGAGNIIGQQQSGYMNMIGYQLYMRLLKQTIAELKGEEIKEKIEVNLDIGEDAYIPDFYIKKGSIKIEFYKKIYDANNEKELEKIKSHMQDRFGFMPEEVLKLFEISKTRLKMIEKGIKSIEKEGSYLEIKFVENFEIENLFKLIENYNKNIEFDGTEQLKLNLKIKSDNLIKLINEFLKFIQIETKL
ncbi:MAG: transcription-repair coupling factor [Candidatus Mcinerneyibacterium aminivorans]|uniref:Transcription-repair-coupling factor n=1 Tax=Candidatus Mcinerneyibacterium aminivorans TaxID=2703815 RepID=A0A5D0MIE9_9BACT|nr:MAG: transcription-repair coupling factor [Candidatus Mcinerneyibacterium aminivorans]